MPNVAWPITRHEVAEALQEIMGDEEWPPFARAVIEWVDRNAPVRPSIRTRWWCRFRCAECSMRWDEVVRPGQRGGLARSTCPGCDSPDYVQMLSVLRLAESHI